MYKHIMLTTDIYIYIYTHKPLSRVRLFTTPWTVAYQDPLSMGFFFFNFFFFIVVDFVIHWNESAMGLHVFPMSMGFSRQEYWSGLPFPSPYIYMCVCVCVCVYTHTHNSNYILQVRYICVYISSIYLYLCLLTHLHGHIHVYLILFVYLLFIYLSVYMVRF